MNVGELMATIEHGLQVGDITEQDQVMVFWSDGADYIPARADIAQRMVSGEKFLAIEEN